MAFCERFWFLVMNLLTMGGGLLFGWWSYDWSLNYDEVDETPALTHGLYYARCGYLILWPYLFCTIMYHWWRSPFLSDPVQPIVTTADGDPGPVDGQHSIEGPPARPKLFYRFVTRGTEPSLVLKNAELLHQVLTQAASLPFQIEIVTDTPIFVEDPETYRILLVPASYELRDASGDVTLFKARALHYANTVSSANELTDWIVHLDEETRLLDRTVYEIELHCINHPSNAIGQGPIVYMPLDRQYVSTCHLFNTLADSIRVSDDYGKFRWQFDRQSCWSGMKGSFIVIQVWNEKRTGFNHGRPGSITEDCFFAMKAFDQGASYRFIKACMFEKSPFTWIDFVKQRRRWLTGLRLVYSDPRIRSGTRIWLRLVVYLWTCSSLSALLLVSYIIEFRDKNIYIELALGWTLSMYVLMYLNGFYITLANTPVEYQPSRLKRWAMALLQVGFVPYFSLLEATAVVFTTIRPDRAGFHVVAKT
jgi:egghead protein (zeste-white 4 protein)